MAHGPVATSYTKRIPRRIHDKPLCLSTQQERAAHGNSAPPRYPLGGPCARTGKCFQVACIGRAMLPCGCTCLTRGPGRHMLSQMLWQAWQCGPVARHLRAVRASERSRGPANDTRPAQGPRVVLASVALGGRRLPYYGIYSPASAPPLSSRSSSRPRPPP